MNTATLRKLQRDPRSWAKTARIKTLERVIIDQKNKYYNEDGADVDDETFDLLQEILEERAPDSPALNVGIEVRDKVKLPYWLGSQTKIKQQPQLERWLEYNEATEYVVSDKLDGISFLYYREDDGDHKLFTRGNGEEGRDISAFLPMMKLARLPRAGVALRGELIMSKSKFEGVWAEHAANARNMVAGITNRNNLHKALRNVHAIVYEYISPGGTQKPMATQLAWAKQKKFRVVYHKVYDNLDYNTLVEIFQDRRKRAKYDIDGIIVQANQKYTRNTRGNPEYAFAFKQNQASDMRVVNVVQVIWRESRYNKLVPRIEIEPVDLAGATIRFATGHNAQFVYDNDIGPGSRIRIVRSGDVIPYIQDVVKSTRAQMPDGNFEWDGVDIRMEGVSNESQLRAAEFFYGTLGAEGIRYRSIRKLVEYAEVEPTILNIVWIEEAWWAEALGPNKGPQLYAASESIWDTTHYLYVLMTASGLFPRLGLTQLRKITQAIPDILEQDEDTIRDRLGSVSGIGGSAITVLLGNLPRFATWLEEMELEWEPEETPDPITDGPLSGETLLFTGFRDSDLTFAVEQAGGTLSNSFSRDVTILVTKDGLTSNNKTFKALELNVLILTQNELRAKYNL